MLGGGEDVNVDPYAGIAANCATDLTLRSYADSDFVRWVDWAQAFVWQMELAPLDDGQLAVVRSVLNMKEVG